MRALERAVTSLHLRSPPVPLSQPLPLPPLSLPPPLPPPLHPLLPPKPNPSRCRICEWLWVVTDYWCLCDNRDTNECVDKKGFTFSVSQVLG